MPGTTWKDSEKKIARRVFEAALQSELADIMATFKALAANAKEPEDMWKIQAFLAHAQRDIDGKYDYRYSQLELVFGRLLREKRIYEQDLNGIADEKLANILRIAEL
ncbi:MAG: hypothetical protein A2503_02635 [Burkholderiales bacterium RIFOXYD12_FULL_59_19]|nr:MAG: hypothetical protein A2503_02635 [Burkholderiales bacterium RIFOXYD12_FULL_59_19]